MGTSKNLFRLQFRPFSCDCIRFHKKSINPVILRDRLRDIISASGFFAHLPCLTRRVRNLASKQVFRGAQKAFFVIAAIFLLPTALLFAQNSAFDGEAGKTLAKVYEMSGVAGFVEGKMRDVLSVAAKEECSEWLSQIFSQNVVKNGHIIDEAALKPIVQAEIKKRLKEWIPAQIKKVVTEDIFGQVLNQSQLKEAEELYSRISKELDTSLNDRVDAIAGQWYDESLNKIKEVVQKGGAATAWLDVTDVKGSIKRVLDGSALAKIVVDQISPYVGDITVSDIKSRLTESLTGELPPEVIYALQKGPAAFDEYVKKAESYFPGNKLEELKNSILNRSFIKIPTQIYASILAATAAAHFAKAYNGVYVDLNELKRGIEVTRVMIWQLENKQYVSLTLIQLGTLTRDIASKFGMANTFDLAIDKLKEPLDKIQAQADKIDELIKKPFAEVKDELKKIVQDVQNELENIKKEILAPIEKARNAVDNAIPEKFNGIPENWDELKEKVGLKDKILGEFGEKSPMDLLSKASDKLSELNEQISDETSKIIADVLDKSRMLGPAAVILNVEKIPTQNETVSGELDPVILHNGEYINITTDIVIPSGAQEFKFTRTYRTMSNFLGELGVNWTHSYAERLLSSNDGVADGLTYIDTYGRKFFFKENGDVFTSPKGLYMKLEKHEDGYELEDGDENTTIFDLNGKPALKKNSKGEITRYVYGKDRLLERVIDEQGRKIEFKRRDDGLITQIKDFTGRTIEYSYNKEKELIGARSPLTKDYPKGKTTAYRYEKHLMSLVMSPNGQVYLKNKFDEKGRIVAQSYGERPWTAVMYGDDNRTWVKDAAGVLRLYEMDDKGHLLKKWRYENDKYILLVSNEYDDEGNRIKTCEPSGRCQKFYFEVKGIKNSLVKIEDYPSSGGLARVTQVKQSEAGNVRGFEINKPELKFSRAGNAIEEKYSNGAVRKFKVNELNQIVREEASGEPAKNYHFDENDNLIKVELNRNGHAVAHEYRYGVLDELLEEINQVSPKKFINTKYKYDDLGRLAEITWPEGNKTRFEYDEEGELKCVQRGEQPITLSRRCVERDVDGNIIAAIDGEGYRTSYVLNGFSEIVEIIDPKGNRIEYKRDDGGKIVSRKNFDNNGMLLAEIGFVYNAHGTVTKLQKKLWQDDPSKAIVIEEALNNTQVNNGATGENQNKKKDDLGRVIFVDKIEYKWDGNGRLSEIVSNGSVKAKYEYDELDRLVAESLEGGWVRRYSYDRRDLVTNVSGSDNNSIDLEYDENGNLASRKSGTLFQEFKYDGMNRIVTAKDDVISHFVYDSLSRPVAEALNDKWIIRQYDNFDRVLSMKLPSQTTYYYSYDDDGTNTTISDGKRTIMRREQGEDKKISKQLIGNNIYLEVKRDNDDEIYSREYYTGSSVWLSGQQITWDEKKVVSETGYAGIMRSFERDGLGRLTVVRDKYSHNEEEGEEKNKILREWKYNYDSNDSPEYDPNVSYKYDELNRLVDIWKGDDHLAHYAYDAFNRRIAKKVKDVSTSYMWNGWLLAEEEAKEGYLDYIYEQNSLFPLARIKNSNTEYLLTDKSGSLVAVTDENGKNIVRCSYAPFGLPISVMPQNESPPVVDDDFKDCSQYEYTPAFEGHWYDKESGLIYMRNRYFSPNLAKFITPDPLGVKATLYAEPEFQIGPNISYHKGQGGASRANISNRSAYPFDRMFETQGKPFKPGELDLYAYAKNDPSTYIDPLGLASLLFDRSDRKLQVLDKDGVLIDTYRASNKAANPKGDPLVIGENGPFPNGTYSIGIPEFYSEEYRQELIEKYELDDLRAGETIVNGKFWAKNKKDTKDYSMPFGRIRIRAGSYTSTVEDKIAADRQLFIHGGRHNYTYTTLGCIRANDSDLEELALDFINLKRSGDPITQIVVQD